ncbi:hypothetical protein [Mycoplasma yeatsii]|uniref:hypothetical protein n=1 Tax=Mycoplasma yeatsii TaxID=51365 RepID=UPI0005B24238|nr:hypothetical protein [Mycoplasma yeatsii]AJM71568.1 hypothetical protein MYE_00350 [Mycoplasma yeatsii GM274B]
MKWFFRCLNNQKIVTKHYQKNKLKLQQGYTPTILERIWNFFFWFGWYILSAVKLFFRVYWLYIIILALIIAIAVLIIVYIQQILMGIGIIIVSIIVLGVIKARLR